MRKFGRNFKGWAVPALVLCGLAAMASATTVKVDGPGDGDGDTVDDFDTIALALASFGALAGDGAADVVEIAVPVLDLPAGTTVNHFAGAVSDNLTIRSSVPGTLRHVRTTASNIALAAQPAAWVVIQRTNQTITFEELILTPDAGAAGEVSARAMQVYNEVAATTNATLTMNRCYFTAIRPTGHPNAGQPITNPFVHAASADTRAARLAELRAFSGGGANNMVELRSNAAPAAGATVTFNFNDTVFTHSVLSTVPASRGGGIALSRTSFCTLNINQGCVFSFNDGSGFRGVGAVGATVNVNIAGSATRPVIAYKNGWQEDTTGTARSEGLYLEGGVLSIDRAIVVGNYVEGLDRRGGTGTVTTITNSIFAENQANLDPGVNISSSSVLNNINISATAGVHTLNGVTVHDVKAGNFTTDTGFAYTGASTLNLTNTIFSGHGDLLTLGSALPTVSTVNETNCVFVHNAVTPNNSPNGLEITSVTYGSGVTLAQAGRQTADPNYYDTTFDPVWNGIATTFGGIDHYMAVTDPTLIGAGITGGNPSVAFAAGAAGVYTWDGGGGADTGFTTAANWNPNRTAGHPGDRFTFSGVTGPITDLPNITAAGLNITGSSSVVFRTPSDAFDSLANANFFLTNSLNIGAGSTLRLRGSRNVTLRVVGPGTGTIAGTLIMHGTVADTRMQLTTDTLGAIEVVSGGQTAMAPVSTGGQGGFHSTSTNYNFVGADGGIIFRNGSSHHQGGEPDGTRNGGSGSNPFGLGAPQSAVVFEPNANYVAWFADPAVSNRTYGNFIWRGSSTPGTLGGGSPWTMLGDLVIRNSGIVGPQFGLNYNAAAAGPIVVGGDFVVETGSGGFIDSTALAAATDFSVAGDVDIQDAALFTPNADVDRTYVLNGTGTQNIDVAGDSFTNVSITGAGPIVMASNTSISGNASNGTAIVDTLAGDVTLGASAVYTTGGGYFQPDVIRDIPAGVGGPYVFEVGTAGQNRVTIEFPVDGPDAPAQIQVASVDGEHPSVTNLPPALNRHWSILGNAPAGTFQALLSFTYVEPADTVGIVNESDLKIGRDNGGIGNPWETFATTVNTVANVATLAAPVDEFSNWSLFESPTLAIDLLNLSAAQTGSTVTVSWETGAELDNAGFVVYRATANGGRGEKLSGLIPAEGSEVAGASYSFVDSAPFAAGEASRSYLLVDIDLSGSETTHGPATATISTGSPSSVPAWTLY